MQKNMNPKYTEDFKRGIAAQVKSGKTYRQIKDEYGVGLSATARWVKEYSEVKLDDDTVLTTQQIRQLQAEKFRLQEEVEILKKALPSSRPAQNENRSYYYLKTTA